MPSRSSRGNSDPPTGELIAAVLVEVSVGALEPLPGASCGADGETGVLDPVAGGLTAGPDGGAELEPGVDTGPPGFVAPGAAFCASITDAACCASANSRFVAPDLVI